ncbi:MAG: metallophosphoesterase [Bacteroidales bacterium]|nr:metallophosphoesterase [Bacteroidales bacterium]
MRLAIISDIHEDIVSLEKALKKIDNSSVDEIACLGDIVGFSELYYPYSASANANECVRLVKENCRFVVSGNHDNFHAKRTPQNNLLFKYPNNWYKLEQEERNELCSDILWTYEDDNQTKLDSTSIYYLSKLPEYICLENGLFLSHYLFPDITGDTRVFRPWPEQCREHFAFVNEKDCNISVSGHMHTEGFLFFSNKSRRYRKYGAYQIKEKHRHIFVPALSSGKKKNGFCIIDFENKRIEGISISG